MKLSRQATLGKIVILAVAAVLLLPLVLRIGVTPQVPTLEGIYIREDSRLFPRFLEGVKENGGVLVLGTSETNNTTLDGANYWELLNRDVMVRPYLSVLAGAGRCAHVWFPAILAHQQSFSRLKVLYFVNPTYWREGLNGFNMEYYGRYNSAYLVKKALPEAQKRGLSSFIDPYLAQFAGEDGLRFRLGRTFREYRSFYSFDLKHALSGGGFAPKTERFDRPSDWQIASWQAGLNLEYNASYKWLSSNTGVPDVQRESAFQYEALKAFLTLAKDVGIDLVVFIGPYNGILARKTSPEVIPHYEELFGNIRRIINDSGVPYIDGSDLSYEPGTFVDAQHHSAYGGWRIEQKIAAYYGRR